MASITSAYVANFYHVSSVERQRSAGGAEPAEGPQRPRGDGDREAGIRDAVTISATARRTLDATAAEKAHHDVPRDPPEPEDIRPSLNVPPESPFDPGMLELLGDRLQRMVARNRRMRAAELAALREGLDLGDEDRVGGTEDRGR